MNPDMDGMKAIFGLPPSIFPPDFHPVAALVVQWEWSNPLAVILKVGNWTIDDLISDPRVAREIRILWKAWKESVRMAMEKERRRQLEEQLWFRRQGCPVPCPFCASLQPCSCKVHTLQ